MFDLWSFAGLFQKAIFKTSFLRADNTTMKLPETRYSDFRLKFLISWDLSSSTLLHYICVFLAIIHLVGPFIKYITRLHMSFPSNNPSLAVIFLDVYEEVNNGSFLSALLLQVSGA